MKRMVCILLSTVLLLSLCGVSAAQQGRVYINDVSASAGDTVTVRVMTENVTACCGGSFTIVYDNDLLALDSCEKGSAMNGISPYINTSYAENKIRITWMSGNTLTNGSICALAFRVKDTAASSAYVKVEELKLSDINGDGIAASSESGYVVIGKGSLAVTDVSLFDFENRKISTITAGSNTVRAEIHNTLSVEAKPLMICALYKNGKIVSTVTKAAEGSVGRNETVAVENVVNVPVGKGYRLTVTVWDGVLNIEPLKNISFAGE